MRSTWMVDGGFVKLADGRSIELPLERVYSVQNEFHEHHFPDPISKQHLERSS